MKKLLWIIPSIAMIIFAFWVVTTSVEISPTPVNLLWIGLLFGIPPLGGFWMMYTAIRYEKRPLPFLLLAFLPFSFVGYYFERVRGKRPFRLTETIDEHE
jgi:hypothetical protein